jgi:hypothetical protein
LFMVEVLALIVDQPQHCVTGTTQGQAPAADAITTTLGQVMETHGTTPGQVPSSILIRIVVVSRHKVK